MRTPTPLTPHRPEALHHHREASRSSLVLWVIVALALLLAPRADARMRAADDTPDLKALRSSAVRVDVPRIGILHDGTRALDRRFRIDRASARTRDLRFRVVRNVWIPRWVIGLVGPHRVPVSRLPNLRESP